MNDIPSQLLNSIALEKPTNGSANKPRLNSASNAQSLVRLLVEADRERARVLAMVRGVLDGNAPFDTQKLIEQGQGNRTNVNFREGESLVSESEGPYYDLFAEAPTYFQAGLENPDPYQRVEKSRIATEEFDKLLKSWAGFDTQIQMSIHEFVAFGRAFLMWPDPVTWQFENVRHNKILVPDGTPADPDQLEILVARQSLTVSKLYGKVRDPEAAKKVGWNVKATMNAIAAASPEYRTDGSTLDLEKIQEEIRNHDLYESIRSDVVRVAHLFVREFSGKISHLIVEELYPSSALRGANDKPEKEPQFLYKKLNRYNSFREVIAAFFFDLGDGTWHSIKGLGTKLYPFIEIKNRLWCSVVDNAFINLSVLLQATTGRSEQETALMQLGPMTILPAGFEVRQWNINGRMEEGLFVERALTNRLENNTGQYRRSMRDGGNPETATGRTIDAQKEAALNKGAVNRYYAQLDSLGEEIFRRATNPNLVAENNGRGPNAMALAFQQRCYDRGLTKSDLKKVEFVRASRNSGNGSMFLRQQVVTQTSQLVPMMNEEGKNNWLNDSIAVLAGSENVTRWNPQNMLNPTLQNEQAYAMLENDALKNGSPVLVTRTQNAFIHATVHMKAATDAINSIPQGGDPVAVLAFLEAIGPHVMQHLQSIAGDPMRGRETKMLQQQVKQLSQITDQLRNRVEQQMQSQQAEMQRRQQQMAQQMAKTQNVMTDEQLRQYETLNKVNNSREKQQAQMQMREEQHRQRLQIQEAEAVQRLAISDAESATSIRTKTAKTASDIANTTAKTKSQNASEKS